MTRAAAPVPDGERFVALFSVAFRHAFYNASADRCPDFQVRPTPACARLMAKFGLLFCDQGVGFSVLIPQARVGALAGHLAAQRVADPGRRGAADPCALSFLLLCTNPQFVGITALPLDTRPTCENLYANNLQASLRAGTLVMNVDDTAGAATSGPALHPTTGATIALRPAASGRVTASNVAGAVACGVDVTAGVATTLDLSGLPHGFYAIAGTPAAAYAGPPGVVYVPTSPITFGLIDLLLAQPAPGQGRPAAFPIRLPARSRPPRAASGPAAAPSATPVRLTLSFAARKTDWQYVVVSQDRDAAFCDDLAITGHGLVFKRSPAALPNGDAAFVFSPDPPCPLPLGQRSDLRFSLAGRRQGADGGRDAIRIERLPTAPAAPVWPSARDDSPAAQSEIYVYV